MNILLQELQDSCLDRSLLLKIYKSLDSKSSQTAGALFGLQVLNVMIKDGFSLEKKELISCLVNKIMAVVLEKENLLNLKSLDIEKILCNLSNRFIQGKEYNLGINVLEFISKRLQFKKVPELNLKSKKKIEEVLDSLNFKKSKSEEKIKIMLVVYTNSIRILINVSQDYVKLEKYVKKGLQEIDFTKYGKNKEFLHRILLKGGDIIQTDAASLFHTRKISLYFLDVKQDYLHEQVIKIVGNYRKNSNDLKQIVYFYRDVLEFFKENVQNSLFFGWIQDYVDLAQEVI